MKTTFMEIKPLFEPIRHFFLKLLSFPWLLFAWKFLYGIISQVVESFNDLFPWQNLLFIQPHLMGISNITRARSAQKIYLKRYMKIFIPPYYIMRVLPTSHSLLFHSLHILMTFIPKQQLHTTSSTLVAHQCVTISHYSVSSFSCPYLLAL
jgi:hypothetical protein